jgi:hypothetical protein
VATTAVIARLLFRELLPGAHRVELVLRAVAVVSRASLQHVADHFLVPVESLRLIERPLVVVQVEPRHALEDHLHRVRRGALHVRVLDAQDELALHAPGIEPAEERGADAADVQHAGGRRGEAGDDGCAHEGAHRSKAVPGRGFGGSGEEFDSVTPAL